VAEALADAPQDPVEQLVTARGHRLAREPFKFGGPCLMERAAARSRLVLQEMGQRLFTHISDPLAVIFPDAIS
jgi:hypothetical protein